MAWIIHDYLCRNATCTKANQVVEVMHQNGEQPLCEECKQRLEKKLSGIKTRHHSWSTWQV